MAELYLIAHKVRGEAAFDIAINIGSEEDGDLWIIPTSGHRAYPYWYQELQPLLNDLPVTYNIPDMPPDLRDHYTIVETLKRHNIKMQPKPTLEDLL